MEKIGIDKYLKDEKINIPEYAKNICIDIGLSYNSPYSQLWLSVNPNRFVIGCEPNLNNIRSINQGIPKGCIQLNKDFIDKKVYMLPCALDNVNGLEYKTFYNTINDPGCSSLYKPTEIGWIGEIVTVPCISAKSIFDLISWDRFKYIEHVKIDAQGNDFEIVKSMGNYLAEKVVYLTVEITEEDIKSQYQINYVGVTAKFNKYMQDNNFIRVSTICYYNRPSLSIANINHIDGKNLTYLNKKFSDVVEKDGLKCETILE